MNRKQYWTCPFCHNNLDYGEKCDCQQEKEQKQDFFRNHLKMEPGAGQFAFAFDGGEDGYEGKAFV